MSGGYNPLVQALLRQMQQPKLTDPMAVARGNARDVYAQALSKPQSLEDAIRRAAMSNMPVVSDVAGVLSDSMMYKRDPKSRTLGNALMTGAGLLPLVPGMTAYHGSPHKFDAFDSSKIGTGEGAQAYGHGLYFAENPGVAKGYKQVTGKMQHKVTGEVTDTRNIPLEKMQEYGPQTGSLYHVDIPDEHIAKMLDWDAPLSEQPEAIRYALQDLDLPQNATGKDVYNSLMYQVRDGDIARGGKGANAQQMASEQLKALGIPGIRYLDAGSRQGGKGTRNFVVFDDSIVKILNRE